MSLCFTLELWEWRPRLPSGAQGWNYVSLFFILRVCLVNEITCYQNYGSKYFQMDWIVNVEIFGARGATSHYPDRCGRSAAWMKVRAFGPDQPSHVVRLWISVHPCMVVVSQGSRRVAGSPQLVTFRSRSRARWMIREAGYETKHK